MAAYYITCGTKLNSGGAPKLYFTCETKQQQQLRQQQTVIGTIPQLICPQVPSVGEVGSGGFHIFLFGFLL